MRASGNGRAGIAAVAVAVFAGAAIAAVAAIDFTGHWTGTGMENGQSPTTLIADLTSSGKKITGTVTSTQDGQTVTCPFTGRQRGKMHVRATLGACKIVLHGTFDSATNTISGHFLRHGRHKTHTGTFTITRMAASPTGAL
jgi:hypothetical protein